MRLFFFNQLHERNAIVQSILQFEKAAESTSRKLFFHTNSKRDPVSVESTSRKLVFLYGLQMRWSNMLLDLLDDRNMMVEFLLQFKQFWLSTILLPISLSTREKIYYQAKEFIKRSNHQLAHCKRQKHTPSMHSLSISSKRITSSVFSPLIS